MKKISVILLACCVSLAASAKILTVNNNNNSPGQYTSPQAAIDSASAGDSIYVHGSATSYGNAVLKKRLNFFGTGNRPNKANILVSEVGTFYMDSVSGISGPSGTKIIGFKLTGIVGYSGSGGTSNILVLRNYFLPGSTLIQITGTGWVLENNIFPSTLVNINNNTNTIIRNNIFNGSYILSSNQPTVVIANNIFLGTSPATALSYVSNALIANNIFSGSSPNGTSVDNNVFSNNITYKTANNVLPSGTNIGSGNLTAQDPMFTNVPINTFNYSYDFSLSAASPGKNAGTDGKDVGIYGGVMPFVDMTGTPAIPQVKSLSILNPVIPVGDSLQVIIKANKHQ